MIFGSEIAQYFIGPAFECMGMSFERREGRIPFGKFHLAKLAGPLVNFMKQTSVDFAIVSGVEPALNRIAA